MTSFRDVLNPEQRSVVDRLLSLPDTLQRGVLVADEVDYIQGDLEMINSRLADISTSEDPVAELQEGQMGEDVAQEMNDIQRQLHNLSADAQRRHFSSDSRYNAFMTTVEDAGDVFSRDTLVSALSATTTADQEPGQEPTTGGAPAAGVTGLVSRIQGVADRVPFPDWQVAIGIIVAAVGAVVLYMRGGGDGE